MTPPGVETRTARPSPDGSFSSIRPPRTRAPSPEGISSGIPSRTARTSAAASRPGKSSPASPPDLRTVPDRGDPARGTEARQKSSSPSQKRAR